MTITSLFKSSENVFRLSISEEFVSQPMMAESVLRKQETVHLPACVQRYLEYTAAIGNSKPQNVYIEFDAEMMRRPGDKPMKSYSVQYNFYGQFSRLFLMKASKMGIPFSAMHIYRNYQAIFQVKVAQLFRVVNIHGEELNRAETVTVLNDMCIFAPGSLIDNRLSWNEIDSLSTKVTLNNGKYGVSAYLYFNESGELVNFISDDRYALQEDGAMRKARWSTPVGNYKYFGGRKIPAYGEARWNYPEGEFTYGVFNLRNIRYNVTR